MKVPLWVGATAASSACTMVSMAAAGVSPVAGFFAGLAVAAAIFAMKLPTQNPKVAVAEEVRLDHYP